MVLYHPAVVGGGLLTAVQMSSPLTPLHETEYYCAITVSQPSGMRHTHHDVDVQQLYHPGHQGPPEEREQSRALERVASVEEQRAVRGAGGLRASLSHGRLEPRETAETVAGLGGRALVADPVGLLEARVHVVGVQHEQPENVVAVVRRGIGRPPCGRQDDGHQQQHYGGRPRRRPSSRHRVGTERAVYCAVRVCCGRVDCTCASGCACASRVRP